MKGTEIRTERIDDMSVLIERLKQMKMAEIIDKTVGRHALWEGLSKGWTGLTWLAHIIMTGDQPQGACQTDAE